MRKRLLIFSDWFTPGFRAGGPIRSVENQARLLSDAADIYIYTGDRDLNDTGAYTTVQLNSWQPYAPGIWVYYATPEHQTRAQIKRIIERVRPAAIHLNSLFSKNFALLPLSVSRKFPQVKTVLSPRGMLRGSALAFKSLKKKFFLSLSRLLKLHAHVYIHATDAQEAEDAQKHLTLVHGVELLPNVPAAPDAQIRFIEKQAGSINIIFTGRIHPIKNLHLLLESLQPVKSRVLCTLVGVMEDADYWNRCREIIQQLPENITVKEPVEMPPAKLAETTRRHHLFVLPTQGENFGHAIFEAFCCGRPALISNQTPWNNLEEKKAGWDLPLNDNNGFTQKIEQVAAMQEGEWKTWCNGAHQLAVQTFNDDKLKEGYRRLFFA